MNPAATLNRGMVMELEVGQTITMTPPRHGGPIVVTLERKSGQRGRIRIQSPSNDEVKISVQKEAPTG